MYLISPPCRLNSFVHLDNCNRRALCNCSDKVKNVWLDWHIIVIPISQLYIELVQIAHYMSFVHGIMTCLNLMAGKSKCLLHPYIRMSDFICDKVVFKLTGILQVVIYHPPHGDG